MSASEERNSDFETDFYPKPTPVLINFVSEGRTTAVVSYLQANPHFDVDARDEFNNTAAIVAAQRNNLPMLQILINAGADLDVVNEYSESPLIFATQYKNTAMIRVIEDAIAAKTDNKMRL